MFKTTEKGFTLVETLVVLAILSAVTTVITASVIIISKTSSEHNEMNVNLRQVQNAGYWISHDALMAQVVDTNPVGDVILSLDWSDWSGDSFNVEYVLEGTTLKRQVNGGASTLIAQYIIFTECDWSTEENKLTVTIRASSRGDESRCLERTYEISPRPVATGES